MINLKIKMKLRKIDVELNLILFKICVKHQKAFCKAEIIWLKFFFYWFFCYLRQKYIFNHFLHYIFRYSDSIHLENEFQLLLDGHMYVLFSSKKHLNLIYLFFICVLLTIQTFLLLQFTVIKYLNWNQLLAINNDEINKV